MFKSPHFRLHGIVLLWGFTGVLGKLISIDSLPLVFYRILFAIAAIAIYLYFRKIKLKMDRQKLIKLLGIGVVIGLHWFFFFESIKVSNVAIALSTLSTGALFTAFLEPLFFKRNLNWVEVFLAIVVAVCIFFIFKVEARYTLGIVYGLICSFLSAVFTIMNAQVFRSFEMKPSKIMFFELIGGIGIIAMMIIFRNDSNLLFNVSAKDFIWLIILGTIFTAIPMIESVSLMEFIQPYTVLLTVNLEPVYGIILAFFIFGESEKMNPSFYFITLVLIGSIIMNGWLNQKIEQEKGVI